MGGEIQRKQLKLCLIFKKMIKVLDLFSGYGGSNFALTKAGIDHKTIGYSDIEDCANYIYDLNHGGKSLGDVTKIVPEELEDFSLLTGGFSCQPFSICGKREGFENKKNGTVFFEIIRIAKIKKPKYMLLENVEGILSHDNGNTMKVILQSLQEIGYNVKWTKLYSKQHGTPQNRPRIWFACFKDIKDYNEFTFPEKEKLKVTVKDLLEDEVDDKYYLNENQLKKINDNIKTNKEKGRGFGNKPLNITSKCTTLTSHMSIDINDIPYFETVVYNAAHTKANGSRFKIDGCTFTLEASKSQSLCIADFRYDEGMRIRKDGCSPTLCSSQKSGEGLSGTPMIKNKRWRRLTPKECFRLQGFFTLKNDKVTFDEIKFGNLKDGKLYFLVGNGWCLNVASKIFKQMFKGNQNKQKTVFEF